MKSILIKNVEFEGGKKDILIEENIIVKIENSIDTPASTVIDGSGKAAIPGFVNMHTHAAMTLMRGVGEDILFHEWIYERVWPVEKGLDDELIYWGTKLACLEMIKTGTTCCNDHYWRPGVANRAIYEMGVRSVQSYVIMDLYDKSKWAQIKEDCLKAYEESLDWQPLNRFAIGVHSAYSVSEELIIWGAQFAREKGLPLHIHISETEKEVKDSFKNHGVSPVKYLDKIGVLGPNVISAHSLWLDDEDIEIFAKRGVTVVHNINSILKLASGYKFRYKEFKEAGVVVTLGTDGCASSNNLDILETMKTSALVQKAWRADPTAMPLNELIDMGTINGAKALDFNSGRIEVGRLADILLVDKEQYSFVPDINFYANLIYSANSSCVDTVICDGKVVMEGRKVAGEEEILSNVKRLYSKLLG
jgi:Cytosine deaminase and related metal-dependent hydrolases